MADASRLLVPPAAVSFRMAGCCRLVDAGWVLLAQWSGPALRELRLHAAVRPQPAEVPACNTGVQACKQARTCARPLQLGTLLIASSMLGMSAMAGRQLGGQSLQRRPAVLRSMLGQAVSACESRCCFRPHRSLEALRPGSLPAAAKAKDGPGESPCEPWVLRGLYCPRPSSASVPVSLHQAHA